MDKTSTTAISRWLRSQRGGRGGHHSRNTEPLDGPASQILACSPKRCASLSSGVLSWGRLDVPPRMFSKYSGWCLARCGRSVSIFRIRVARAFPGGEAFVFFPILVFGASVSVMTLDTDL